FAVDTTGTGSNNTPTGYRYVNPVVATNALWWNALTASIKAEGYGVTYIPNSPTANTASFAITASFPSSSGNSGVNNTFIGNTFTIPGAAAFAGGLDASGSTAGDTLTVDGVTFTMVAATTGSSITQVSVTGSSEALFENLRSKIQTQTGFN
ncbi:MAG TPA: hypothetical protein DCM40_37730, partial [Maribacter sp.]|nr:hypothetical protein [Maribacter sp.]